MRVCVLCVLRMAQWHDFGGRISASPSVINRVRGQEKRAA